MDKKSCLWNKFGLVLLVSMFPHLAFLLRNSILSTKQLHRKRHKFSFIFFHGPSVAGWLKKALEREKLPFWEAGEFAKGKLSHLIRTIHNIPERRWWRSKMWVVVVKTVWFWCKRLAGNESAAVVKRFQVAVGRLPISLFQKKKEKYYQACKVTDTILNCQEFVGKSAPFL